MHLADSDHSFSGLRQDVPYALRMFRRNPTFAALAVASLALGIGANTGVFSVFDAVLLRPLPFRDARRLIAIWESDPKRLESTGIWNSYRDLVSWKRESKTIEDLAGYSWVDAQPILRGKGTPRRVFAAPVTPNFFSLLGARAALGRTFVPEDQAGNSLVVLSHAFWETQLGANPTSIGKTLNLDGQPYTIIGVMPPEFEFYPKEMSMWTLLGSRAGLVRDPNDHSLIIFGKLRAGVHIERAQDELCAIRRNVNKTTPDGVAEFVPVLHSLQEDFTWLTGRNLQRTLMLVMCSVIFLMLIACLNVANLLLTRGAERSGEFAIRSALGSGRARLLQQLLTEALVLSLAGTALGVIIATGAVYYFRATNPLELPPGNPVAVDLRVLAFSATMGIITTLLCGLMPAWRTSKADVGETLKGVSRESHAAALHPRTARILVIAELSLSLVLLVGAGLMIQSVSRLAQAPLGFRPDHLLALELQLPTDSYAKPEQVVRFFDELTERVRRLPSVAGTGLSYGFGGNEIVAVEDLPAPPPNTTFGDCSEQAVSGGFFSVEGIPLFYGRDFSNGDRARSERVAIVNQAFVSRYLPHRNPIGQHVRVGASVEEQPWLTIVGVVGNVKGFTVFREMALETTPTLYRPFSQAPTNTVHVLVRFSGDAHGLAAELPRQVSALDANLPVGPIKLVAGELSEKLKYPAFRARILILFAILALLLASVGVYGVVSQMMVSRTREIGIRAALGATRRDIIGLISREGIHLALAGTSIGLLISLVVTRTLASLLYETKPADPATLGAVICALCAVTFIATFIPARRAANLDPMSAIRHE